MDEQEIQNQEELQQIRAQEYFQAQQAAANNQPELKRMGWGIFVLATILIAIQVLLDWFTVDIADIFFIPALINGCLWLLLRPYRDSMKQAGRWMKWSLVFDSIPILDWIPIDFICLIWAFAKSRSHRVQQASAQLEAVPEMA